MSGTQGPSGGARNSPHGAQRLAALLTRFTEEGVPPLKGFKLTTIDDRAYTYLLWLENETQLEELFDWKSLTPAEEARQSMIKELVFTEADYIKHLIAIVEVLMAAAHAAQDASLMLELETERLFNNLPDVLNASLAFWEASIFPMLADADDNNNPYNTEHMHPGFYRFREVFAPYEKYVSEQTRALAYLRGLQGNAEFAVYLAWCQAHEACNRLQLSDMLVKPMQRLTKYALILRRIINHTDAEPERTSLLAMESYAKNYVLDLNRSIRQREEIEKLDNLTDIIDIFEIDFKDEEMDRLFRAYANLNLRAPMVGCLPSHSRSLVHEGDLRFKDQSKEIEVHAFLLTDMLLICKKLGKNASHPYKLIRPKFMVDRMMHFPQLAKGRNDLTAIMFVMIDEVGSAFSSFAITEPGKDSHPQLLKIWEQKIREAKMTYELSVWFARQPSRDISDVDPDSSSDYSARPGRQQNSDDWNIEREARERVAAMLHRGASTEYDWSQASMCTDSFDGTSAARGGRGAMASRHPMLRTSTGGSSRASRSSFQQSTSAASHDEPTGPRNVYRAGSSVEHLIPGKHPEDAATSITVKVVSESESETVVPAIVQPGDRQTAPEFPYECAAECACACHAMHAAHGFPGYPSYPTYPWSPGYNTAGYPVLYQPGFPPGYPAAFPYYPPGMPAGHYASTLPSMRPTQFRGKQSTLKVAPQSGVMALVHSLPDLTVDMPPRPPPPPPSAPSASEKLYQSHQELLAANSRSRLAAQQHFLSPDSRGTSYPPPSPTRASLKRGLAFSYSFKNPPLSKMGHVNSESQMQTDAPAGPPAPAAPVTPELTPPQKEPKASPGKKSSFSRKNGRGKKGKGRTSPIQVSPSASRRRSLAGRSSPGQWRSTPSPEPDASTAPASPAPASPTPPPHTDTIPIPSTQPPVLETSQSLPTPQNPKVFPRRGFLTYRRTVSGSGASSHGGPPVPPERFAQIGSDMQPAAGPSHAPPTFMEPQPGPSHAPTAGPSHLVPHTLTVDQYMMPSPSSSGGISPADSTRSIDSQRHLHPVERYSPEPGGAYADVYAAQDPSGNVERGAINPFLMTSSSRGSTPPIPPSPSPSAAGPERPHKRKFFSSSFFSSGGWHIMDK